MEFISTVFHFLQLERIAGLIPPLWFHRTWRKRHSNQHILETSKNYSSEDTSCNIKKGVLVKNLQSMGAGDPTTSQSGESSIWSRNESFIWPEERRRLLPSKYKGPINRNVRRLHSRLSGNCQVIWNYYFQSSQEAALLVADTMWWDDFPVHNKICHTITC